MKFIFLFPFLHQTAMHINNCFIKYLVRSVILIWLGKYDFFYSLMYLYFRTYAIFDYAGRASSQSANKKIGQTRSIRYL